MGVFTLMTRHGLDGLGIGSWWEQDFLHMSVLVLGPVQLPVQWVLGFFPRGKVAGAWH